MVVTVASKVTGKPYDPWTLIEDFILPAIKD
jgi:hypothetical protein